MGGCCSHKDKDRRTHDESTRPVAPTKGMVAFGAAGIEAENPKYTVRGWSTAECLGLTERTAGLQPGDGVQCSQKPQSTVVKSLLDTADSLSEDILTRMNSLFSASQQARFQLSCKTLEAYYRAWVMCLPSTALELYETLLECPNTKPRDGDYWFKFRQGCGKFRAILLYCVFPAPLSISMFEGMVFQLSFNWKSDDRKPIPFRRMKVGLDGAMEFESGWPAQENGILFSPTATLHLSDDRKALVTTLHRPNSNPTCSHELGKLCMSSVVPMEFEKDPESDMVITARVVDLGPNALKRQRQPVTYLTLNRDTNFSTITWGTADPLTTHFQRVRLNLPEIQIDCSDFAFSETSGPEVRVRSPDGTTVFTHALFGFAQGSSENASHALIDLRGTPLKLSNDFEIVGNSQGWIHTTQRITHLAGCGAHGGIVPISPRTGELQDAFRDLSSSVGGDHADILWAELLKPVLQLVPTVYGQDELYVFGNVKAMWGGATKAWVTTLAHGILWLNL